MIVPDNQKRWQV